MIQRYDNAIKRIVVNADDFGLTTGINRGIISAFDQGILSSASLMACGTAFEDACRLSDQHPDLDVGLHLVLVGERPVTNPSLVPSLVDKQGRFSRDAGHFIYRALLGRINWDEVELELTRQIQMFQRAGFSLTHIDSHQHVHVYPPVFKILKKLARAFDIGWVRNPHCPWERLLSGDIRRLIAKTGLNLACACSLQSSGRPDFFMPDGMYGFSESGGLSLSSLEHLLSRVKSGIFEIITHPGIADEETRDRYGHWNYDWDRERYGLTAEHLKRLCLYHGLSITTFRALSGIRQISDKLYKNSLYY